MNPIISKIIFVLGILAIIVSLLFVIKSQHDLAVKQQEMNAMVVEMRQLTKDITVSQSKLVTKEQLNNLIDSIDMESIQEDIERLNATILAAGALNILTPGGKTTNLPGSVVGPEHQQPVVTIPCPNGGEVSCPPNDPFGYNARAQVLELSEPFNKDLSVPFGKSMFQAWEPKPWTLEVYPRQYSVSTVIARDENDHLTTYHKFQISTQGKSYSVPIKSDFIEQSPTESKFRFSPRIYLGVDVGARIYPLPEAEGVPNLSVALFGIGKTKNDPNWSVLKLGAGVSVHRPAFVGLITPITYNIGHHLPLMNNLHIGPTFIVDTTTSIGATFGISAGL